MLGGGQAYAITDPYDSAWAVQLSENAKVYARVNEKNGQPVIWENQYGKGKFVVDNFGLYEKWCVDSMRLPTVSLLMWGFIR